MLVITWRHLFCRAVLEAFTSIESFHCKALAANEGLLLAFERQEGPMMPLLSELVLWVDPKSNQRTQLFSLRVFDDSLMNKLVNEQVASRRRENGTSYDIRFVLGAIEHYHDQDLETWP